MLDLLAASCSSQGNLDKYLQLKPTGAQAVFVFVHDYRKDESFVLQAQDAEGQPG